MNERVFSGMGLAAPQTARGVLTVFPLVVSGAGERTAVTLEEALEERRVELRESGSVPEVFVTVQGDRNVLVLEGDVLVGGWQNRAVNVSLLLEAGKEARLPVSCVERGRWGLRWRFGGGPERADAFRTASSSAPLGLRRRKTRYSISQFRVASVCHAPLGLRRRKTRYTLRSLQARQDARADQGEVWFMVRTYLEAAACVSPTDDLTSIYERRRAALEDLVGAFEPLAHQVGAVIAQGGRVMAVEAVEHPETWRRVYRRVLGGYAADVLDLPEGRPPAEAEAEAFWRAVQAAWVGADVRPAPVGLGEHRLLRDGGGIEGLALVHAGRLYHLFAFSDPGMGP